MKEALAQSQSLVPTLSATAISKFTTMVFGWMTLGLAITAAIAFFISERIANDPQLAETVSGAILPLFLVELVLVIVISAGAGRMNALLSSGLFIGYSAINGVFFGAVLASVGIELAALTFVATMATFGVMAIFGAVTKQDLTKWGSIAFMGLIGIIIASLVNIFAQSSGLDTVITYAGLLIFVVLTAYDVQKLKSYAAYAEMNGIAYSKLAISAALSLYLDFINIFLFILRILGGRE